MVIRVGLYDDTLRIWDSASGMSACMPALVGSLPDVSFFSWEWGGSEQTGEGAKPPSAGGGAVVDGRGGGGT